MISRNNCSALRRRCRTWWITIAIRSFLADHLFTRLPFGTDREMGQKLTEKFGVPVAAGLTAEVEALKAMEIKKLVVGTPYEEEINQRLKRHLEASGFEVLQIAGYGVRKNAQLTRPAGSRILQNRQAPLCQGPRCRRHFHPVSPLADDYRRGIARAGDRQASDHQQPRLYLARAEAHRHQGKCERLRTVDGKSWELRNAYLRLSERAAPNFCRGFDHHFELAELFVFAEEISHDA